MISPELEHEIIAKYQAGLWMEEIARQYNTTRHHVLKLLRENGVKSRQNYRKTCEKCGTIDGHMETHDNKTLCRKCHMAIHVNERKSQMYDSVVEMYASGASLDNVAAAHGVSATLVSSYVKEAGIMRHRTQTRKITAPVRGSW